MDVLPTPPHMCFTGNISETWRRWRVEFELYLKASGRDKKPESCKVATLLLLIGPEGREEYSAFRFADGEDKDNLETVFEKFDKRCNPRKNILFQRYSLWKTQQKEGEPIDTFATRLKSMALHCEYGDLTDSIVRDCIVFGIQDDSLKERLLRWQPTDEGQDMTLSQALSICRATEATREQMRQMKEPVSEVDEINQQGAKRNEKQKLFPYRNYAEKPDQINDRQQDRPRCGKCGYNHKWRSCPAYGQQCHGCGRFNHFRNMCSIRTMNDSQQAKGQVQEMDTGQSVEDVVLGELCSLEINTVSTGTVWYATIETKQGHLRCKLDTGAQVNVLPIREYEKLTYKPKLLGTDLLLTAYGGQKLKPVGKCFLDCSNKDKCQLEFYVIDLEANAILGLQSCVQLQLIQRVGELAGNKLSWHTKEDMLKEFSDVFEGNGEFTGEVHLVVDENVRPVVKPPRKVPYALHSKLKDTLDSMLERGIIQKVNHPTDWVSDMVLVEKSDGTLRICLDARELNKALKRAHHAMSTAEHAIMKLANKKYYTIMDIKEGFWCVKLDQASANLCTFHTPFGRYQFIRLPFGLSVSPEIFQNKLDENFGDIEGAGRVMDDFAMGGKTLQEHDSVVREVLNRAREKNIKFKKEKLQWRQPEVKYVGKILTDDGVKPDRDKVIAIKDMPVPQNRTDLKRFLGMVNFFGNFIPGMSEITAPLRSLLRQNAIWCWEHEHSRAVSALKNILTAEPVLAVFDHTKDCLVQADASRQGLGGCLLQGGKPVAFVSKSLSDAESRYAQIELELLSIVFACEKFYTYIYGRHVRVQTDHKPLLAIVKKDFHSVSPRLQRMLLRLQRYDLELEYTPGKNMYVADTLSRASLPSADDRDAYHMDLDYSVHAVLKHAPITPEWTNKIKLAAQEGAEIRELVKILQSGWPEHKRNVPSIIRKFWDVRHELYVIDDIVFKGNNVFVPETLRRNVLDHLHASHLGVEKTKARARTILYWPGMGVDIEKLIQDCGPCMRHRKAQQKETLIPHPVPERPWQQVAVDLFAKGTQQYLLLVDQYSKFPEVCELPDKTATSVIKAMQIVFARFGVPDIIYSDNMPFGSGEFKDFSRQWGFSHITSSPGYAQSNGQIERWVQTIKGIWTKAAEAHTDPWLALLELRATPLTDMKHSPAELLFGRQIKGLLPVHLTLLTPPQAKEIHQELQTKQEKEKRYYDRNAKDLKPLKTGDRVGIDYGKRTGWEPGKVIGRCKEPRAYWVKPDQGMIVRRNRRQLRATNASVHDGKNQEPRTCQKDPEIIKQTVTRSGRQVKTPNLNHFVYY